MSYLFLGSDTRKLNWKDYENKNFGPGGGIGRHKGLKIPRRKLRAGSSPALGTILKEYYGLF